MSYLRALSEMNLLVRSKDRDRVQGPGDSAEFRLPLQEAIEGKYRLIWATVPNACFNVNSKNNKLYLTSTAMGDTTITIPSQNYTGETLADTLQSLLINEGYVQPGETIGIAYLDTHLKLQFTLSAGAEFKIYCRQSNSDSAHAVLGFETSAQDAETWLPQGQTRILPNVVALGLPTSLGIQIKECSTLAYSLGGFHEVWDGSSVKRGTKNHSASLVIPFLASSGGYQSSAQDRHDQFVFFPNKTKYLNIRVVSPDSRDKVDLNGADWEMLLSKA